MAGLEADNHQAVAQPLGRLDVPQGALDHGLGAREPVLVDQVFLQAAGVHPDPHRDAFVPRLADDLLEPFLTADVAGVDPDLVHRRPARRRDRLEAGQGHPVVIVDVGDQGDADPVADQLDRLDVVFLRDGDADDLAARLLEAVDLLERGLGIEGIGRRHRLDPDRLIATDHVITHSDFARLVPLDSRRIGHRSSSRGFDVSTSCARSTCADSMSSS